MPSLGYKEHSELLATLVLYMGDHVMTVQFEQGFRLLITLSLY